MNIFGCAKHDFCLFVLDIGVCFANNATFTGDIFFVNSNFCYNYGCCVPLFLVRLTYCYMYRVTFQTGAWVTGFTMKLMLQLQGDISIGCYNCRVYFLEFLRDATITGFGKSKCPLHLQGWVQGCKGSKNCWYAKIWANESTFISHWASCVIVVK